VRYVARAPFVAAAEFALPSPYVPRLPALRELGAGLFTPGRPVAEAAIELMHRLHAEFHYESRSTDVDTPLQQVLLQKRGVCQDFAHLLAGVLRAYGLPARYVSGYLLTHAPQFDGSEGAPLLGADASHAWVQLWCPGTPGVPAANEAHAASDDAWLDLDPTNDCVPGSGHVRVAVGRDFGDVTPLRGVIRGGGHHTLAVAVTTRRIDTTTRARELLTPRPMENTEP
jgi:transglutaminase-like putative cysteine protease